MSELPTGTVTFLFTDIEGSTRLLARMPDRYGDVLAEHQRVLRLAFDEHGGREVGREGDSFFVAFERAHDALAAAVDGQRALACTRWPERVDLRVRMGIHTGEAALRGGDYVGLDVHRAARISSAGHGGQVLVSSATHELVADELPPDVALHDLGEHRLKDLERPVHLFEVVAADLPSRFPPPGSLSPVHARIPAPPTATIGREADLARLGELLAEPDTRLVTLVGPGGVGKTRLALELARGIDEDGQFAHGTWFVGLAGTTQPVHVASVVAQALALTPLGGETPHDAIMRFLAPKESLIVLDNFEHLLAAAPIVTELLAACPALTVLTTSREPLRVDAEHCFAVSPLEVPADGRDVDVERTAASALFVERSRRHDATFAVTEANAPAIADICRRLDGLPLAIELAAARTPLLDPQELSIRLARSLDALGPAARDAPPRQRTLRATIDWSHRLLTPDEAQAFARFAVFAGGATVEAAERVTGGDLDTLEGLVDKHLLQRRYDAQGKSRLVMLETVLEYARERLDADEGAAEIRRRHEQEYVALVESAEAAMSTTAEAEWLPRLDAEVDNLRAALDSSIRHGDPNVALRLAGLLAEFWDIRGMAGEGLEWLQTALDAAGDHAPIHDRARACRAQLKLLEEQGSTHDVGGLLEQARARAIDALALSRQAGDPSGIADALLLLGHLETADSLPQRGRHALAEEALSHARQAGDDRLIADALKDRATALPPDQGAVELEQAISALRKIGAARTLAGLYNNSAYNAIKAGTPELAQPFLEHADSLARELGDQIMLSAVCGNAGLAALFTGDIDAARTAFDEELWLCHELVTPWFASEGLAGLSAIAIRHGDLDRAARLHGAATAHGFVGDADVLAHLEREFFRPARKRYGDRQWREAHTAGAELSFDDAIGLALDRSPIR
jgi:predicted ATPase/class 3 adenylate cyclase